MAEATELTVWGHPETKAEVERVFEAVEPADHPDPVTLDRVRAQFGSFEAQDERIVRGDGCEGVQQEHRITLAPQTDPAGGLAGLILALAYAQWLAKNAQRAGDEERRGVHAGGLDAEGFPPGGQPVARRAANLQLEQAEQPGAHRGDRDHSNGL